MIVIKGWFFRPSKESKTAEVNQSRYRFMNTFLTESFVLTYRRMEVQDLVVTGDTRFTGGLFSMQELYQVVSLKDEFNPFYVSRVVKDALLVMLRGVQRTTVV